MGYSVKILADSISPSGKRITTFELTYPRLAHADFLTHRLFSRNAASSRAIPVKKMMDRIRLDPVEPVQWGKNQSGMQAAGELVGWRKKAARYVWLLSRWPALFVVWLLMKIGIHKQLANRISEPWMFITVILTSTEYDNYFKLRDSPLAQPELAWVARKMREALDASTPKQLKIGEWHLPLIIDEDILDIERFCDKIGGPDPTEVIKKVSAGRCARVSYLTHDGRKDLKDDITLAERLMTSGHWSPLEHVAQALENPEQRCGNFLGWRQYRADVDKSFVTICCPQCKHIF